MKTAFFKYDWKGVGAPYNDTEEKKTRVLSAVDALEWLPIMPGLPYPSVPMMVGLFIREVVSVFKIPRVSRVAHSSAFAPAGFIGVTGNYAGGLTVDLFFVDEGDSGVPVLGRQHVPVELTILPGRACPICTQGQLFIKRACRDWREAGWEEVLKCTRSDCSYTEGYRREAGRSTKETIKEKEKEL